MPKAPISTLLCSSESARYLGVTRQTLYNWRHEGKGPRWIKVGRLVRYPESALKEFLDEAQRNGGGQAGA